MIGTLRKKIDDYSWINQTYTAQMQRDKLPENNVIRFLKDQYYNARRDKVKDE